MKQGGWSVAAVWRGVQLSTLLGWLMGTWLWHPWGWGVAGLWLGVPGLSLGWQALLAAHTARWRGAPPVPWAVRLRALVMEWGWNLRIFAWQVPWRAQALPDTAEPTPVRGVLLVHGHGCNRAFWLLWMRWLRMRGVPYASVSLAPFMGDIDRHAPEIDAALQRLARLTGQAPLILAHSKGGLVVRAWWRWALAQGQTEAAVLARVQAVITLGSPHQGTVLAQGLALPHMDQMQPGSAWLQALAAAEPPAWRSRMLCVASRADTVVFPVEAAGLPGAATCVLPDCAHIELAFDPRVQACVWQALAVPAHRAAC
jgi:triacylglycerol lipase